ncbi:MAG: hypothetical protein AB7I59_19650 [Geminicoccaceae bacterium]
MSVRSLASYAYEASPLWLDRPWQAVRRHAMPLLRREHALRRLTGVGCDGRPARVLLAGAGSALDVLALARGFFASAPKETPLGSVSGPALCRRLAELCDEHDLVLARTWNRYAGMAAEAGLLTMPDLPEIRLAVGTVESTLAAASSEIRRIARRCDEEGFRLHLTAGSDRFEEFYRDYHLPFVRHRHGADLVASAAPALRRRLRRGGITWAMLGDEPRFAVAYEIVDGTFRELVAGTPGGCLDPVIQRARAASRAGHVRLAAERGLPWLSMGGCRPWLSDGLLASKRAWGGQLVPRADDLRSLLVGWSHWTPAIARFLADHPLVLRTRGGFAAISAAPDGGIGPGQWRHRPPVGIQALHVVARSGLTSTGLVPGIADSATTFDTGPSSSQFAGMLYPSLG